MLEREENIFYNLIKNETSLTEAFCNLMRYKAFRDLFLNYVNKKNNDFNIDKNEVNFNDFTTEKDFSYQNESENNGRADLVLSIDDKDYIFEIKVELYTSLTPNQPKGYLKHLNNEDSRLFFILPRGYLHLNDLNSRWHQKTNYPMESIKKHILYWDELLNEIKKHELDKLNIFIREFCSILDYRWFKYDDIVFTKEELTLLFNNEITTTKGFKMLQNRDVPSMMNKLFLIIDEAAQKLYFQAKENKQNPHSYGYYLTNTKYNIPDKWDVWFGVDYEIWGKKNLPITIQVLSEDTHEMAEIQKFLSYEIFESSEEGIPDISYIPLNKSIFEGDKNISEELVKMTHEAIEKISSYKEK